MAIGAGDAQYITLEASADLSASQFCAVGVDSAGEAALAQGNSSPAGVIIGILQNKPNAQGKPAVIQISGISKIKAGATLATIGALITSDATGEAVGYATTDFLIGILLTAAGADSDIVDCLLRLGVFID